MERVLRLSEAELRALVERPGTEASRPAIVRGNSLLDRFLNYVRWTEGASEFR
jgi:hypothetical protein